MIDDDNERFTDKIPAPHRLSDINRRLHSYLIDCPVGSSFFWTDGRGPKVSGRVYPHIRDLKVRAYLPEDAQYTMRQEARQSDLGVRIWRLA